MPPLDSNEGESRDKTLQIAAGDVKDMALAEQGKRKIEWANQQMPVLQIDPQAIHQGAAAEGRAPFRCVCTSPAKRPTWPSRCAMAAPTWFCAPRIRFPRRMKWPPPWLRIIRFPRYAIKGEDNATYYSHLNASLDHKPQMTMDDGADLVTLLLTKHQHLVRTSSAEPKKPPPA